MACSIRSWTTALGVWAAAVSSAPGAHGAQATLLPRHEQQQQQQQAKIDAPSLLLRFTNPTNGSRVDGPDVFLHYKIWSSWDGGRELSNAEVRELAPANTVCFKLHGFNDAPEICAPLRVSAVTIKDALPAKWHTVTGFLKDGETGRLLPGSADEVSVFNSLNGYGVLDMCGESACLESSDLRAAYFDHIYR